MQCSDTGKVQAVRVEHLDTDTAGAINGFIDMFIRMFKGNGRITLYVNNGKVQDVEESSRMTLQKHKLQA